MAGNLTNGEHEGYLGRAVEAAIRIGLVALIALWALRLIWPFVHVVLWAAVLAVALYPFFVRLKARLGGRTKLTAALITVALLAVVLVPSGRLIGSGVVEAREFATKAQAAELAIPPPPEGVRDWPLIGETTYERWSRASQNLEATIQTHEPEIEAAALWALSALTGLAGAVVQLLVSILIAGVLLHTGESAMAFSQKLARRLAGQSGDDFLRLTTATIRSVFSGVLGIALIQAALAGIGLVVLGAPGALLWALGVLILAIVQIPPVLALLPVMVWAFATQSTVAAAIFLVYGVLVGSSDTVLKPLLLGRGVDVPMLVILLGAIGGMIASGLLGLFIGAVVLAVAYQLMMAWLEMDADRELSKAVGGNGHD
jgi:predicted PurR-regulated permease PerM